MLKSTHVKGAKPSAAIIAIEPKKERYIKSKELYKSYRKKKKSGRKCRICGNDAYPNYFFCPSCHHRVDTYEEG